MPKSTFRHLPPERQKEILKACKAEFTAQAFDKARVSGIISRLNIARGSFYKYFENLEECYFYLLSRETTEMHNLFQKALETNQYNMPAALNEYGGRIAEEIYREGTYALYRSRYLGWTPVVQKNWRTYCQSPSGGTGGHGGNSELMHCIKAVIHSLIQRIFLEDWPREVFLKKYRENMNIIIKGIKE